MTRAVETTSAQNLLPNARSDAPPSTHGTSPPSGESNSTSAKQLGHRIDGFDLVRVLSAFNVVLFHVLAVRNGLWGRGSVIAFVMIAAALPAMRPELGPFGTYARRRGHRILLPWVVWSAVYGLIAAARYLRSGTPTGWTMANVLIGTCEHLWFFVYIFLGSLVIWGLLRALANVSLVHAAIGLTLIAAPMIVINAHYPPFFDGTPPFGIWWRCVPALLLGMAFGFTRRMNSITAGRRMVLFIGSATLAAAVFAGMTGSLTTMLSFGIPAILLPLALLLPWKNGLAVEFIADVSMGIYATHPLMLLVLRHFWGDTLSPFVSVPAVFVGALAISKAIKHLPGGRLLV